MSKEECYECEGTGEFEYCLDCDTNVENCECSESSGSYTDACGECNGTGEVEEDDE